MRPMGFGIVAALLVTATIAVAQPPAIVHEPVACAVAERFPRLTARFDPPDNVAVARLLFQGQTADWYSVAMKAEGSTFAGVLPKPRKDLRSFRYYIEVTDKALGVSRTTEFTTSIVPSSGACKGGVVSATVASASVVLQGPAGLAALPAGFASSGVVAGTAAGTSAGAGGASAGAAGAAAAGGGIGATALVIGGLAAGGAVAAGVAVSSGKSSDSSTPISPTPTPTPTPTPIANVAGTWVGRAPDGWTSFDSNANCGRDDNDVDLVLTQNGSAIGGTIKWTIRASFFPADIGKTNTQSLTGTLNGNALTFSFGASSTGITPVFSGTFTPTRITGTIAGNSCQPMPFAVNRQ